MQQDLLPSDIARLRDAVARIEAGRAGARSLARGRRLVACDDAPVPVRLGDGTLPLDAVLGGGLRRATLHEVVAARAEDAAAAAGFALAAAGRAAAGRAARRGLLVWIVEDCAAFETGVPYRPGLAAHGIDPDRLILVRTRDARSTLWALEESLRLRARAVLAELWGSRSYGLAPSRRLLLAAREGGGTAILLHAGLAGRGATLSSAAETRLAVAASPSPRTASAGHRLPVPGAPAVTVQALKLRLGAGAGPGRDRGFDRDETHAIVWNPDRRCFDDHPLHVGLPAAATDRPAPAERQGFGIGGCIRHARAG